MIEQNDNFLYQHTISNKEECIVPFRKIFYQDNKKTVEQKMKEIRINP